VIAFERRASVILYNLLRSRQDPRPFLMPVNACRVVPETFIAAAQPFELVDIGEPWLAIDALACVARIRAQSRGYAGLLYIRPYGSERDPGEFFAELKAAQPDILIIDDKCLCRPDCDGASLVPGADVTLFSTGRAKYADIGGGGFAHVAEPVAYARAGTTPAGWLDCGPPDTSWNEYRRRTIDAAFAADAHKRALNAIYESALPRRIRVPDDLQRWRFNIRVPTPDRLIESAFACGLFASRHYPPYSAGDFPVASRISREIVNLFNDRYFGEEQAGRMAQLVLEHLERH
jgi:hypothetical protein